MYGAVSACLFASWPLSLRNFSLIAHRLQAAGGSAASVAALHALMKMMPNTFTLGEALVTVQVSRARQKLFFLIISYLPIFSLFSCRQCMI